MNCNANNKPISFKFAWDVINNFYRSYYYATKVFHEVYGGSKRCSVNLFCYENKRWRTIKYIIHYIHFVLSLEPKWKNTWSKRTWKDKISGFVDAGCPMNQMKTSSKDRESIT